MQAGRAPRRTSNTRSKAASAGHRCAGGVRIAQPTWPGTLKKRRRPWLRVCAAGGGARRGIYTDAAARQGKARICPADVARPQGTQCRARRAPASLPVHRPASAAARGPRSRKTPSLETSTAQRRSVYGGQFPAVCAAAGTTARLHTSHRSPAQKSAAAPARRAHAAQGSLR